MFYSVILKAKKIKYPVGVILLAGKLRGELFSVTSIVASSTTLRLLSVDLCRLTSS